MAKIDDLLQRRAKQIVLAVVARLAHGSSLTANLAVKRIMNPASRESQNARNPTSTPGFLAKSITCSGQITTINQSLPNSSRATEKLRERRSYRFNTEDAVLDRHIDGAEPSVVTGGAGADAASRHRGHQSNAKKAKSEVE
jgi:hypothetical protein